MQRALQSASCSMCILTTEEWLMIETDCRFFLNGFAYWWVHDARMEPPEEAWRWEADENAPVALAIVRALTRLYLDECVKEQWFLLNHNERERYAVIVRSMRDFAPARVQARRTIRCRDCKKETGDYYPIGQRCVACHEAFWGLSRARGAFCGRFQHNSLLPW